jgi:hypothetical protein
MTPSERRSEAMDHPWMLYAVCVLFFVLFIMGEFIVWRAKQIDRRNTERVKESDR